ncbi:hypothetical protein KZP23_05565 [Echinicola marina]|uniref:hypothetical protein n=1 Tax=Echinicola marina TaxID=2859768 RepID=UPI001CF69097|nr:hypothetical protein [Echinicola marina]UCS94492.1 hypothetical protein KZP23_05565 [Echinicola marina]
MTNKDLKQEAADLEKQLEQQIGTLKKESETWVKLGGAILAGGVLSYGVSRMFSKKKDKKLKKLIKELDSEGNIDKNTLKKATRKRSSVMSSMGKRLFMVLLSVGQAKLMDELSKKAANAKKKA